MLFNCIYSIYFIILYSIYIKKISRDSEHCKNSRLHIARSYSDLQDFGIDRGGGNSFYGCDSTYNGVPHRCTINLLIGPSSLQTLQYNRTKIFEKFHFDRDVVNVL